MGNFIAFTEIGKIYISNAKFKGDVSKDVSRVSIDISTDMSSEVSFSISDPELVMLRNKSIPLESAVTFQNEQLIVSAIELYPGVSGTGAMMITCRSRLVHRLKKRKGKHSRSNISPTSYLKQEVEAVGGKFVGQSSPKRKQIVRDIPSKDDSSSKEHSTWTTMQRLAGEEGFYAYESEGVIYFGKPTWLSKRNQKHTVKFSTSESAKDDIYATEVPECRKTLDGDGNVEVTVKLPISRFSSVQVGESIVLSNFGMFSGTYLITGKTYTNEDDTFDVTAVTPDDPEKSAK